MEHFNSVEEFKEYIIANPPQNYWIGAPGTQAYLWDYCYNYGIYATGWGDLGDYSEYKSKSELKKEGLGANDQNTIWSMCNDVQIGDVIFAREGKSKIIGMGVVKSDYKYDPKSNIIDKDGGFFYSIREVKWLKLDQELNILPKKYTPTLSSCSIGKEILFSKHNDTNKYQPYIDHLRHAHNIVLAGAPGTGKTFMAHKIAEAMNAETDFVQFHPSYDYTDFVEGLRPKKEGDGFERADGVFKIFCKKALKNLEDSKKNEEVIKKELSAAERIDTFLNDAIAESKEFSLRTGNSFYIDSFNEKYIKAINKNNAITSTVSIRYDDLFFLISENKNPEQVKDIKKAFDRALGTQQDSYLFVLCKEIAKIDTKEVEVVNLVERKDFVFIIDEINRGEISKIFGELFYAIDPGYRGDKGKDGKVKTQYQNLVEERDEFYNGFYVPENVYIIGTMNDIDRSVESMDFAIRRRFSWIEVTAEESAENMSISAENRAAMKALNDEIAKEEIGLGTAYQIGGSYFMKEETPEDRWKYHLEPLLREYLRGENKKEIDRKIEQLKDAYNGVYQNKG